MKTKLIISILVILSVLNYSFILNNNTDNNSKDSTTKELVNRNKLDSVQQLIGTKAPQFILKDIDNNDFPLNRLKDKFILIEFWGVGCGACIMAEKSIHELDSCYKSHDLDVIGIAVPNKYDSKYKVWSEANCRNIPFFEIYSCFSKYVKLFKEKYKFKQLLTLIDDGKTSVDYRVKGYPTFFLVDKNGVIIYARTGYSDSTKDEIRNLIVTK